MKKAHEEKTRKGLPPAEVARRAKAREIRRRATESRIFFWLETSVKTRLERAAARRGEFVSDWLRDAIQERLRRMGDK